MSTQASRLVPSTLRKVSQASKRQLRTGSRTGRSCVGSVGSRRHAECGDLLSRWNRTTVRCLGDNTIGGIKTRSKSSVAYAEDDDYEFTGLVVENHPSKSDAAVTSHADSVAKSHVEAWMINLGRNNDDSWLTGDREDKWWTGVHPRECPGTCS